MVFLMSLEISDKLVGNVVALQAIYWQTIRNERNK